MNYWHGQMNWPLDTDWKCEICKQNHGLEWGLVHAQARCNVCHTQYRMRDKENQVVTIPICALKPEYKQPWQDIWDRLHTPIEQVPDSEFELVEKNLSSEAGR